MITNVLSRFFMKHSVYSYDGKTENPQQRPCISGFAPFSCTI